MRDTEPAFLNPMRWTLIVVTAMCMPILVYAWSVDRDVTLLGWVAFFAAFAGGALVRIFFRQRQHRPLVAWLNGVAATAALAACAVRFDLLLASVAANLMIWELAVAVAQLVKPKVDNAR